MTELKYFVVDGLAHFPFILFIVFVLDRSDDHFASAVEYINA